uniref:Ski_Sno domain-containing protein n=1 Tax=Steinernema glaseri TaxID=37863 RepID=A0A1I7YQF0_9BILA
MICLPQVFELFLKKYVGGMHTVYTKLKRLNIEPLICNVEQVRALRSLGAIQPGVNRCKLINRDDFDKLYDDCTNACARPGRPPKRSPHEDWGQIAKKEPRYDSGFEHSSFGSSQTNLTADSMASPPPPSSTANPMQLFGNLFSFGAPQLLMQQMMAAVAQQQPQPRQNPFSNESSAFLSQNCNSLDDTLDEEGEEEEEVDGGPHSSMSSALEDNKSDEPWTIIHYDSQDSPDALNHSSAKFLPRHRWRPLPSHDLQCLQRLRFQPIKWRPEPHHKVRRISLGETPIGTGRERPYLLGPLRAPQRH